MKVQVLFFAVLLGYAATLPNRETILVADSLDISNSVSYNELNNIRIMRYTKIYIRAFDTYGSTSFDESMAQTIQDAYSNSFHVELYMAPNAYTLTSGAVQVQRLYDGLIENNLPIDKLWIQVTNTGAWPTNTTTNCALIDSALNKARELGFQQIGIFTSATEWFYITNNWKEAGNDVLLWYWNNKGSGKANESPRSFDDFTPFGNWTQAEIKQFGVNVQISNTWANYDIYVLQRHPW